MNEYHNLKNTVEDLLENISVSGRENIFSNVILKYFKDEDYEIDALNSLKIRTKGSSKSSFLLDAHIDGIALVVTDITENGFLKVGRIGSVDRRILNCADISVHTNSGVYQGVVTSVPPHLQNKKSDEYSDIEDVLIDVGMDENTAKSVISPGDTVSFNYKAYDLLDESITAPTLDNKAGIAVLIRVYEILKERNVKANVTYLFSSQEEVGLRGAKASSFEENPDEAIVVDVSFATAPGISKTEAKELGKGPMICISPIIDKSISDSLIMCAKSNENPYQLEVCPSHTGTNADVITVSGKGMKAGLVSVPLRNMHTFCEIVSFEDIENSARLIAKYIEGKAE